MTTAFKPATQAKQLMLDFYAVVSLQVRGVEPGMAALRTAHNEVDLAYYIRNQALAESAMKARTATIAAEHNRLLRDLPLINAAEIGHCDDCGSPKHGSAKDSFAKRFGKVGAEWWTLFKKYSGSTSPEAHKPPAEFKTGCGYVGRYIGAMTASKMTGISLVEVSLAAFDKAFFGWGGAYGGPKWLKIAEAWRDLTEAKTELEIIHCIDIINALEHNTCTLFNKCQHYGGYGWVSEVLDLKFAASSPLSFVGRCSKELQPFILATREVLCALNPALRQYQKARFAQDADGEWFERPASTVAGVLGGNAAVVKQLSNGVKFQMQYNGKMRVFSVEKVVKALDGSRQFMARAQGWSLPKLGGITVTHFPFDEIELSLWPTPLSLSGSSNPLFKEANHDEDEADDDESAIADTSLAVIQALHKSVSVSLKASGMDDVSLHGLHNTGNVFRFRITKPGETNCRFYVKMGENTFQIFFSHTNEEVDLSSAESLSGILSLSILSDAASVLKISNAIVQYANSVWNGEASNVVLTVCASLLSKAVAAMPAIAMHKETSLPKPVTFKNPFLNAAKAEPKAKSEASSAFDSMMQAQAGESADANTKHVKMNKGGVSVVIHKDVYSKYLTVGETP